MKSELDFALQKVEDHMFNNPQALAQLAVLERSYYRYEKLEQQLADEKAQQNIELAKMQNILDMLQLSEYEGRSGFFCREKVYREIEIVDAKKFMSWLKTNCTPDEIIKLLTPPTKMSELKKFLVDKFDENKEKFDFEIDGVITKSTFTVLKLGVRNGNKKTRPEISDYHQKREHNYKRPGHIKNPRKV